MIKENAFAVFDTPPKKGESNIGEKQLFEFPELEYTERTTQRPVIYSQIDAGIEVQRGKGGFDKNGDYIVTQTPDLPYSNVICGEKGGFIVTQTAVDLIILETAICLEQADGKIIPYSIRLAREYMSILVQWSELTGWSRAVMFATRRAIANFAE